MPAEQAVHILLTFFSAKLLDALGVWTFETMGNIPSYSPETPQSGPL